MSDDPNQQQSGERPPAYGQPDYGQQPYSQPSGQPPYPPSGAPGAPGPNPYPAPPAYPGQGYQGYQGYPPPGGPYGAYAPPGGQAFNFQTLMQRWQNVLTRPSVPTFDAEQPAANWQTILMSLLILGVVEAVSAFITGLGQNTIRFTLPNQAPYMIHVNPVGNAFGELIGAFVVFFVLSVILYISAKVFNGQGTFLTQSWLLSLFFVPLSIIAAAVGIIAAIVGFIPFIGGLVAFVGGLVAFAAFVYGVYLAVLAIASAHRLTTGRATAAVLLPLAILFVLACVFAFVLAALILTILRGVGY